MFLIDIVIKTEPVPKEQAEKLLEGHRAWFKEQFEAGHFLVVGPYRDQEAAGIVMAQAESRGAIEALIAKDSYYPDKAVYTIREFQANLIADNVTSFRGK